jgi:Tetracyclin repressor-like, C-terminal domain
MSELIDLMYDRALGELPQDYGMEAGRRAAVCRWADDTRAFYLRHPWMLQVSQARPVLGPNEFAVLETLLRIVRDTGLEAKSLRGIAGALLNLVRAAAQTIADTRQAPAATGLSDDEWWYARSALLEEVAPDFAERYPTAVWAHSASPPETDDDTPYLEQEAKENFEVGLAVFLDGIETAVRNRQGSPED